MKKTVTLAALAISCGSLSAQTTTWYGVTDNSGTSGTTIDAFSSVALGDWHDTMVDGRFTTSNLGLANVVQVRPQKTGGLAGTNGAFVALFKFNGLSITDTITNAELVMNFTNTATTGVDFYVTPITFGSGWQEATATWDSVVMPNHVNLSDVSRPFQVPSSGWGTIPITSVFQDFIAGNNDGIAIIANPAGFSGSLGAQPLISADSADNLDPDVRPGLVVTTVPVPEPSSALLGALGALFLLRRKRQ